MMKITNKFMQMAIDLAGQSPDPSIQNGALVVRNGTILSYAFNRFPRGVVESDERWTRPLKYQFVEHAERGAVYDAARAGISLKDADMYCPWASCCDCARAIAMSDIGRLIRFPHVKNERWDESVEVGDTIMREAGVEIVEIEPVGFNFGDVRLGNKD